MVTENIKEGWEPAGGPLSADKARKATLTPPSTAEKQPKELPGDDAPFADAEGGEKEMAADKAGAAKKATKKKAANKKPK